MNLSVAPQAVTAGTRPEAAVEQSPSRFAQDGFIGPIRIFSREECSVIAAHLRFARHPRPTAWDKGRAVSDPFFHRLATHPNVLSLIGQVLGEDVILWGANAIKRKPGQVHHWHTDIESAARPGFASIWIGIENTSRQSGLLFASKSHTFDKPIQQVAHERGVRRGEVSSEAVLGWARGFDADATLVQPDVGDGDGLLFDGRIWHGSHNTRESGERVAILLQYAASDAPVRMPDFTQLEWPFRFLKTLPPAIVVRGKGRPRINRLVSAPRQPRQRPPISTWIHPLPLPLPEDAKAGWKPYRIFRGPTAALQDMGCHVSVLSPGHSPHPPHIHPEEELLIPLDGEAEIVFADDPQGTNARIERLRPGSFTYYPTDQHHTIHNASVSPITYLMFKWRAAATNAAQPLGASVFHYGQISAPADLKAKQYSLIFQQPTAQLSKLHAHLTIMPPGAGYEPHSDPYDVTILALSGKLETLGRVVEPHGVIYYSAGAEHGMKNVGATPARYLVFEFHGSGPHTLSPAAYWKKQIGRFISPPTRRRVRALKEFAMRLKG
jgi:uncharacterized cupin superfamily protein